MKEDYLFSCQSKKEDFASVNAESHYRPDLQLEPVHEIINLTFSIKDSKCSGSVVQRVKANVSTKTSLKLNAINFTISKISSFDSSSKKDFPITWDYDGSIITINWEQDWSSNETRDVEIQYEVVKPISGLFYSYPDEFQPNKPIFVGADHETERARYWLPCVDHPSIRTTLEFFLTSDKEHIILANGKLLDEKVNGELKTAHWVLDFPCPSYLTTICIGDLIVFEDRDADAGNGPIQVKYFTTKRYSANDLKLSFDRTPKMLEWINKKLGVPLPYPKYYQYALPMHGGAMENISLVSWDDFAVLDEIAAKENAWLIDHINLHEMTHSWFGDAVVIKDFAHAWLKESWATYMDTVWLEEMVSQEEADYDRFVNQRTYKNETKRYVRPIVTNIYDSSWSMFDSHLYPGGAQRIDMLRKLIGDKIFWSAVTDYLRTFQKKVAETSDFQRKLEQHSGLNLQKFFDQWYYSKGFPILKISFKYDDNQNMVELKIKQTQVNKERGIGLFEFNLEIKVETEENNFKDYVFTIKDDEHVFYINSDKKPLQIVIDEENKVLMDYEFNPKDEMLKRIYSKGSIKNKILSANELAKNGSKTNIKFLVDQYNQEHFWGLKVELINALGSIYDNDAINALLNLVDVEKDPMVLQHLIKAIENVPLSVEIVRKMKHFLATSELLYWAHTHALQVIGAWREDEKENFEFLKNYPITTDKKGYLQSAKRSAIGKLRSKEATEYLLTELQSKKVPITELTSLINALTDSVKWADKKEVDLVKQTFIDQIKLENDERILRVLARALGRLEDPSLNKYIMKIKSKISVQSYPVIDGIVEKNKGKSPSEDLKNLEEKVKKIEKENLELKEKIAKIEKLVEK